MKSSVVGFCVVALVLGIGGLWACSSSDSGTPATGGSGGSAEAGPGGSSTGGNNTGGSHAGDSGSTDGGTAGSSTGGGSAGGSDGGSSSLCAVLTVEEVTATCPAAYTPMDITKAVGSDCATQFDAGGNKNLQIAGWDINSAKGKNQLTNISTCAQYGGAPVGSDGCVMGDGSLFVKTPTAVFQLMNGSKTAPACTAEQLNSLVSAVQS